MNRTHHDWLQTTLKDEADWLKWHKKTYPTKPIYDTAISYRTPGGRKVRYFAMVAADTLSDCEDEIIRRLKNEQKFGRRRVAEIIGEFSATFVTMQISTR